MVTYRLLLPRYDNLSVPMRLFAVSPQRVDSYVFLKVGEEYGKEVRLLAFLGLS